MENFRIERLEINKIGAFEHLQMDFPKKTDPEKAEIHILTGENGTGKSTILTLMTGIADNSNENFYYSRILSKGMGDISGYSITYTDKKGEKNYFKRQTNTDGFYTSPEALQLEKDRIFTPVVNYAFFAYSNNRYFDFKNNTIQENPNYDPFKDAVNFNKPTDFNSFKNWILSTKTRALVAKANGNESEAQTYVSAIAAVEKAIAEITGQTIEFVLLSKPTLHLALKIDGIELGFEVLPDGIKSMIIWMGDLLMRLENIYWIDQASISLHQNFILFLDEIEVHLHPAWQRKILPVVQKLFKNAQIFISTHSPFVVGSVDGAWVHKLKKVGAYAVLDGEPVLSEDGKSVRRILDEIFGINEQYGVAVENELKQFREFRQKIMLGQDYDTQVFDKLVKHLASQSTELEQLMGMEMNQRTRITQKTLI